MDLNPATVVRDGLSAQQIEFAIWMAQTPNLVKACKAAGVPEQTARRWMTQLPFIEEYARVSSVVETLAMSHLKAGVAEAAAYVREVVADTNEPTETRLKAAKMILDTISESAVDSAQRLADLRNPPVNMVTRPADSTPINIMS